MLPGWSRLTEQCDPGSAQLFDSCRQVADGEPNDGPTVEVPPAPVVRTEDLDMPAIGQLEDPKARVGVNGPLPQHVLVEARQLLVMFSAGAAPAQARDVHACQSRCQPPAEVARSRRCC
jgi:hypothetical protein